MCEILHAWPVYSPERSEVVERRCLGLFLSASSSDVQEARWHGGTHPLRTSSPRALEHLKLETLPVNSLTYMYSCRGTLREAHW
jgi:hypothetical protein